MGHKLEVRKIKQEIIYKEIDERKYKDDKVWKNNWKETNSQ